MEPSIVKSKRIFAQHHTFDGALVIRNGLIEALAEGNLCVTEGATVDYGDCPIIPGIIETHNHGFFGWSTKGPTEADVRGYLNTLPAVGITGVLPTVGPDGLRVAGSLMGKDYTGARMHGLHSFGPFLNESKLHDGFEYDLKPTRDLVEQYYAESCGQLRLMTLAPEIPDIPNGPKPVL